mmetsp:Transcript_30135/g.72338  ORF Transcript_30135/g.72338 Transcript_30135/m.72338 type:complete len:220 (+) Transcript_30135:238-897(+)
MTHSVKLARNFSGIKFHSLELFLCQGEFLLGELKLLTKLNLGLVLFIKFVLQRLHGILILFTGFGWTRVFSFLGLFLRFSELLLGLRQSGFSFNKLFGDKFKLVFELLNVSVIDSWEEVSIFIWLFLGFILIAIFTAGTGILHGIFHFNTVLLLFNFKFKSGFLKLTFLECQFLVDSIAFLANCQQGTFSLTEFGLKLILGLFRLTSKLLLFLKLVSTF